MVELPLAPWFRMTGGARIEQTKLSIDPFFEPWNRPEVLVTNSAGQFAVQRVFDASQITAKIEETDVLPAIGFNWEIVTNLHLRGNWSQTIARPTFRELSPVSTFEFFGDDLFVGNPNLQIARADNYDLRLEWFRRPGDLLSAGVFYKEIQEPIERVRFSDLFRRNFITMINYPNGQIYGVEGEVRQRMDVLHEWLKDFTAGANATLIFSRVEIPPDDIRRLRAKGFTDTTRAMRDQPEYLFNANLVYENQKSGTSVGLFYNVTGKTLVAGPSAPPSAFFSPAVYEEPIDSLDLGIEQKIGKHWALFLRAKNLTDPLVRRFYDVPDGRDITYSSYRKGMDFSLGASCSW
jgi:TonB-dependent receptor